MVGCKVLPEYIFGKVDKPWVQQVKMRVWLITTAVIIIQ